MNLYLAVLAVTLVGYALLCLEDRINERDR